MYEPLKRFEPKPTHIFPIVGRPETEYRCSRSWFRGQDHREKFPRIYFHDMGYILNSSKTSKYISHLSGLRGGEFVRDVLRDAGLCSLVA